MPWFADTGSRRHKSSAHRSRHRVVSSTDEDDDDLRESDVSSGSEFEDAEKGSTGGGRYGAVDTRRRSANAQKSKKRAVASKPAASWFGLGGAAHPKEAKGRHSRSSRADKNARRNGPLASVVALVLTFLSSLRKFVDRLSPKTSHGWGILVLLALFTLYVIDFYSISNESAPHPRDSALSLGSSDRSNSGPTQKLPFSQAEAKQKAPEPLTGISEPPKGDDPPKAAGSDAKPAEPATKKDTETKPVPDKPADPPQPPPEAPAKDAPAANPTTEKKDGPPPEPEAPTDGRESPFARTRTDLAVPGGTGKLPQETIKEHYRKLARAYLAPFADGIRRKSFFNILMRRTYSLTPPGANKGIQSMLFQIKDKKLYLLDPYKVPQNSKPFYKSRINEMIWILSKMVTAGRIPDTEFLVSIHDCVQTVSKTHPYRAAKFAESNPSFTIVSCNFSDNIPFPMWEGDELRGGGYSSWEGKMKGYSDDPYPWSGKTPKAVFRGGIRQSTYFGDKAEAEKQCDTGGRVKLAMLGEDNPDLFDVSVSGTCQGKHRSLKKLTPQEHHQYKYIFYAEGNCFWADRINRQLFGPSVILMQQTPCGQFFEPLLKPMVHFVDVDFFFNDAADKIKWLQSHDEDAQQIARNANEFAWNFLSLNGIETYIEAMMEEYTNLLSEKEITIENGAVDVTDKVL